MPSSLFSANIHYGRPVSDKDFALKLPREGGPLLLKLCQDGGKVLYGEKGLPRGELAEHISSVSGSFPAWLKQDVLVPFSRIY